MRPTCASCRHFHVDARNMKQGHCQAHPPQATPVVTPRGVMEMSIVPIVNRAYTCGEHSLVKPGDALALLNLNEKAPGTEAPAAAGLAGGGGRGEMQ